MFSSNNDAFSTMGQVNQPNKETTEMTSPIRPKKENGPSKVKEILIVSPSNEKNLLSATGKGKWKKSF